MPRSTLTLAPLLALAALAGGCRGASFEPVEYHDHRSFPAADGKLVRIDVFSLNPEIDVAPGDAIAVEVSLSARAASRAAAARWVQLHAPQIDDSPAALEIHAAHRRGSFVVGSLRTTSHLRIVVPASCRLEVTTSSGEVSIDGSETLSGPVRLTTTSGDVSVRGGVRVLEVQTVSGDLKVAGVDLEQLQVRSTSGNVTVRAPLRSTMADTTSGTVRLDGLVGDLSAHTTSGDLRAAWGELAAGVSIRADTTSGDVRLRLPSLAVVTGELRTRTGTIRTRAPGRWERKNRHFVLIPTPREAPIDSTPDRGGVSVQVSTRSGDISLRST